MSENRPARDRPAPDVPATDGAPEIWRLDHPEHGVLEFAVGSPEELRTVDPGYPLRKPSRKGSAPAAVASPGCALLRDGEVIARARQISDRRFSLTADPPKPGEHTTAPPISSPRIQVRTNMLDTAVRQVTFREVRDVVYFDPPPGSAAEARLEAIASTPWKRAVYPVAAGIGRSGWAIAMIVLLPLIGRLLEPVLDWILERIPDIDIPWPEFSLPSIPWPAITLPSINLPEISIPGWVEFLLEYSKVWVPLLAGVALAVVAVRQSRRSRETKRRWAAGQPRGHSAEQPDEPEQPDHPGPPEPPERAEQPGRPADPSQGGDESSGGGPAGR
ncbi:hypothetical protein [Dietzia lutea]|uniref:Uncharacterized protein n=2 Tax=Dietzia lutea TaxID=546160 RepID=A0A2S1R963_9ACTN|nr:hypothetical protein [Dietzia lutea]AWH92805.1 hypothetical protein A6035_12235 [Dietzia lutea]